MRDPPPPCPAAPRAHRATPAADLSLRQGMMTIMIPANSPSMLFHSAPLQCRAAPTSAGWAAQLLGCLAAQAPLLPLLHAGRLPIWRGSMSLTPRGARLAPMDQKQAQKQEQESPDSPRAIRSSTPPRQGSALAGRTHLRARLCTEASRKSTWVGVWGPSWPLSILHSRHSRQSQAVPK